MIKEGFQKITNLKDLQKIIFTLKKRTPFFLLGLMLLFVQYAWSNTITVCSSCETKTIKEAIAKAEEGDTILVKPGIYKESNIKIDKGLTLIGEGLPTIDGEENGEIVTIGADNVTIDGFKIINVGVSYTTDFASVRVVTSKNFVIQNLVLEKLFFGIYIQRSHHEIGRAHV